MKKNLFTLLTIILISITAHAEKSLDFTVSFEPTLIVNTDNPKNSAPSPVVYPFSFGIVVPSYNFISFQPRLSFFTNYYLWNDKGAYPAEIENRTATAFSFLLDLPVGFVLFKNEKHLVDLGTGPAFLIRFATLSHDVSENDAGYNGNTASKDVEKINEWFWNDANFLFYEVYADYLYSFTEKIKAGPEVRFYLPLGSLFSGDGLNAAMLGIGIKARF